MPVFNLLAASVESRSRAVSAESLINLFPERQEDGTWRLYGTPGKRLWTTVGDGPIRGGIEMSGTQYVVSGNAVYSLTNSSNATLLGTLSSTAGKVYCASNGTDILLVDGVGGYTITAGVLATITDPDFPNGVTWCDYVDSFFIVGGNGTQRWYKSGSLSGTAWEALEFASSEGDPDLLLRGIVANREILLFGSRTLEFWMNTGAAGFPFERSGNAFIEHGVVAPDSVVKLDSSVFWLGRSAEGQGIVWRLNGYQPVRISTHAEEYAISQWADMADAYAWAYMQDGHAYYVLSSESGDMTLVYDASQQRWHRRAWRDSSNGLHRDRICHYVNFSGLPLGGDHGNGRLYVIDMGTYTDNGDTIVREIISTHVGDGEPVSYDEVELYMETGVGLQTGQGSDPQVTLSTSGDYGATFGNERPRSLGLVGQYGIPVRWLMNGMGRFKTFKLRITDPVKVAIRGWKVRFSA
jgi:hypothetical protein